MCNFHVILQHGEKFVIFKYIIVLVSKLTASKV